MDRLPRHHGSGAGATAAARDANDRIAAKAQRLRFGARVPFLCECGDAGCRDFVLLLPQDFAGRRAGGASVTLAGHPAGGDAGDGGDLDELERTG